MVYTYLLKSSPKKNFYVGITDNLQRRLLEHNSGKVGATRRNRPYELVYQREHLNYGEARKHEKSLKKKNREYKEKLVQLPRPFGPG